MGNEAIRIIQISDTHLFANENQSLLGVQTQKSFEAVLKLIQQENKKIDLVLHSGDIAQDHAEESYIRAADWLSSLNAPVYCVPGNHDDPKLMDKLYPHARVLNDKVIEVRNWKIILLDSHKHKAVEGYLDRTQLDFLETNLQVQPQHHTIIMFHHQPVFVGCEWLDNLGLTNAKEFWEIISRFPQVHTVLFGHVHQEQEKSYGKIKCYSAPSTCFQFMRHQDNFGLENLPQGYRWIHLHDDGRLETAVVRAPNYIGSFDNTAKGY